jgi:Uma2 family endonuclease
VKEELRNVTIAEGPLLRVVLPDSPYRMWVDGTLHDYLHVPHDGTHVEIIDGEIVVSPAPRLMHNAVVQAISDALAFRRFQDPSYRWRCVQTSGVNFVAEESGYIPDLVVLDVDVLQTALEVASRHLVTDQVEMVVEVTSPATAERDRPQTGGRAGKGKWSGYACAEVPYYLLVDLDPRLGATTLFSIPDQGAAAYLHRETWGLGETITLPEPFAVEVSTSGWKAWA